MSTMAKFYGSIVSILLFSILIAEKHDTDMKTSIIIPCYYKHAPCLYELLKTYEQQSELPDEIIISLSNSSQVSNKIICTLQKELWSFPITLILSQETLFAGENRNRACAHATGDIFICQDADDIPHPQRVEIIKYFFKNHPIDHLMHQWVELKRNSIVSFDRYEYLNQILFFYPKTLSEVWYLGNFTNGNVAITKQVFDKVKWNNEQRGQDTIFNDTVYKHFKECIAINVPLLVYRSFLSSTKKATNQHLSVHAWYPIIQRKNIKIYPLSVLEIGSA